MAIFEDRIISELLKTLSVQLKPYGMHPDSLLKVHEPYKRRLVEIVKRTSLMGESNSVVIIGPRGSGKSALIEWVINELLRNSEIKSNLLIVKLNGLIHTDDNIALKDIMYQLKMENTNDRYVGSFAEKLNILLQAFRSGRNKQSKSILFILDEFDLFCSHKDQTLLYNLFDVAQSQQSPICIVGLSCRPDILDKLENRVKSRFSHQQVHLFDRFEFAEYINIAKNILHLKDSFPYLNVKEEWNANVDDVLEHPAVKDVLLKWFNFNNSIRDLKRFLFYPVSSLSMHKHQLLPGDFIDAFNFYTKDAKITVLQGLSILELSLVIAMMHLTELYDGEPFNFEMVYHEYKKFLQKKMNLQTLDRAVVMKAFEHLLTIEFVKPATGSSFNMLKRYCPVRLLLEPNEIKEALKRYSNLPDHLQQWAISILVD